jgi:4-aminobutyrate aminotransferase-like enzyme
MWPRALRQPSDLLLFRNYSHLLAVQGVTGVAGGLGKFEEKFEVIGDMRGMGPMLAMELVKDKKTKKPNPEIASKVMKASLS